MGGHHMYTVGLETDTRAYFSGVTILISLPTGTKIFNWLSTYLGNPSLLQLKTGSLLFGHLLVYKSKNLGSWVYQLMIQFIVLYSFFLQDYISFIFWLVFSFVPM